MAVSEVSRMRSRSFRRWCRLAWPTPAQEGGRRPRILSAKDTQGEVYSAEQRLECGRGRRVWSTRAIDGFRPSASTNQDVARSRHHSGGGPPSTSTLSLLVSAGPSCRPSPAGRFGMIEAVRPEEGGGECGVLC